MFYPSTTAMRPKSINKYSSTPLRNSCPKTTTSPSKSAILPKIVTDCPTKCWLLWWSGACSPFNVRWRSPWSPQSRNSSNWSGSNSWKPKTANSSIYWKDNDSYIIILVGVLWFPSAPPSSRSAGSDRCPSLWLISLCLFPVPSRTSRSTSQFPEWSSPSTWSTLSLSRIISRISSLRSTFHSPFPSLPSTRHFFGSGIASSKVLSFSEFWLPAPAPFPQGS